MDNPECHRKRELIEKAIKNDPINFGWDDMLELEPCVTFDDIREMIKRVYNLSEDLLTENSDASNGNMGKANRLANNRREKLYKKRIRKRRHLNKGKLIVAEGDSWFQFPFFINDIIDWLNKNQNYVINCLAYAGDWITNIIYEAKYISELSIYNPDVFLVSGGGNDLVGGNRLAIMIEKEADEQNVCRDEEYFRNADVNLNMDEVDQLMTAQKYVRLEFYAFLNVIKLMYHKMFIQLQDAKRLKNMKVITQGYDYPYPRWNSSFNLFAIKKSLVNWIVGSGRWLKRPMEIRGVDNAVQSHITKLLILEFNQMYIELANHHKNVYHIDCRGIAPNVNDWFDELHLKSKKYKQIAKAYQYVIESTNPDKITYAVKF